MEKIIETKIRESGITKFLGADENDRDVKNLFVESLADTLIGSQGSTDKEVQYLVTVVEDFMSDNGIDMENSGNLKAVAKQLLIAVTEVKGALKKPGKAAAAPPTKGKKKDKKKGKNDSDDDEVSQDLSKLKIEDEDDEPKPKKNNKGKSKDDDEKPVKGKNQKNEPPMKGKQTKGKKADEEEEDEIEDEKPAAKGKAKNVPEKNAKADNKKGKNKQAEVEDEEMEDAEEDSASKKKAKGKQQQKQQPKGKKAVEEEEEEEEEEEKPAAKGKGAQKNAKVDNKKGGKGKKVESEDEEMEDDEEESKPAAKKGKEAPKKAAKSDNKKGGKGKKVESDEEESDEVDEEMEKPAAKGKGAPAKKSNKADNKKGGKSKDDEEEEEEDVKPVAKGKGAPQKAAKADNKKGGKGKKVESEDEEMVDEEEEEEKPVVASKKAGKEDQKNKGKKGKGKKEDSDQEPEEEEVVPPAKGKKGSKAPAPAQGKKAPKKVESEEEVEDEVEEESKPAAKKGGKKAKEAAPVSKKGGKGKKVEVEDFADEVDVDDEEEEEPKEEVEEEEVKVEEAKVEEEEVPEEEDEEAKAEEERILREEQEREEREKEKQQKHKSSKDKKKGKKGKEDEVVEPVKDGKKESAQLEDDRIGSDSMSRDIKIEKFDIGFPGKILFKDANLQLNHGHRYGLVAPNGTGKSTLLTYIAQRKNEFINIPKHFDIHYVEQEVTGDDSSALDSVIAADTTRTKLLAEEKRLQELEDEDGTVGERLAEVYARLDAIEAYSADARASSILSGLQFTEAMKKKATKDFSGGWRMRIALARALFRRPTLLLLDEPTNHLDLFAVIWLEAYLNKWKNTLLVVSHDQDFLNSICTDVVHVYQEKLNYYKGNYDKFKYQFTESVSINRKNYEKQQKALKEAMKQKSKKDTNKSMEKKKERVKVERKSERKNKNKNADAEEKKSELLEAVPRDYSVNFEFPDPDPLSVPIIQVHNAGFTYEGTNQKIFEGLEMGIDMESRIALVGPNGTGKSTFLKLLEGELEPTEGNIERNRKLVIGKFTQHFVDKLTMNQEPVEYLHSNFPEFKPEELRKMLGRFGLTGQTHVRPITSLSGGQKSRVVFTEICMRKPHILFLDEPTNHLDIESVEALAEALNEFKGGLILVSHDSRLISDIKADIWICGDETVEIFDGDFEEYRQMKYEEYEEKEREEEEARKVKEEERKKKREEDMRIKQLAQRNKESKKAEN